MLDFLRDSIWNFIAVVVAIIALLIPFLQRKRKELSYRIVVNTPLVSVSEELEGRVKVLLDDQPVSRVNLLIVAFANTGNVPILANDYYKPIQISINANAQILPSLEIVETDPIELKPYSEIINNSQIIIMPCLLNPSDSFQMRILVSDFNNELEVESRIVGIKSIKERYPRDGFKPLTPKFVFVGFILVILGFLYDLFGWDGSTISLVLESIIFSVLEVLGYIFLVIPTFFDKKYRDFILDLLSAKTF